MKTKAIAPLAQAAFVLFGILSPATAQTKAGAPHSDAEQTLRRIEQEIVQSLLKRDPSANQRYLAEDVVLTDPEGVVSDKKTAITDVTSADLKLESSSISDMKVRVYGDTAVVTYRTTDRGSYRGKRIDGQHRWTDVFVKRNGNWQVVASHGSNVAAR